MPVLVRSIACFWLKRVSLACAPRLGRILMPVVSGMNFRSSEKVEGSSGDQYRCAIPPPTCMVAGAVVTIHGVSSEVTWCQADTASSSRPQLRVSLLR